MPCITRFAHPQRTKWTDSTRLTGLSSFYPMIWTDNFIWKYYDNTIVYQTTMRIACASFFVNARCLWKYKMFAKVTGLYLPTTIANVIVTTNALTEKGCQALAYLATVSCACSASNLACIAFNRWGGKTNHFSCETLTSITQNYNWLIWACFVSVLCHLFSPLVKQLAYGSKITRSRDRGYILGKLQLSFMRE